MERSINICLETKQTLNFEMGPAFGMARAPPDSLRGAGVPSFSFINKNERRENVKRDEREGRERRKLRWSWEMKFDWHPDSKPSMHQRERVRVGAIENEGGAREEREEKEHRHDCG